MIAKPKQEDIPKEVLEEMEDARRNASRPLDTLALMEHFSEDSAKLLELPTKQGLYCAVDDKGVVHEEVGLIELVKLLGHEEYGRAYFTAWILTFVEAVRRLRDAGEVDAAIEAAIELGFCLARLLALKMTLDGGGISNMLPGCTI